MSLFYSDFDTCDIPVSMFFFVFFPLLLLNQHMRLAYLYVYPRR